MKAADWQEISRKNPGSIARSVATPKEPFSLAKTSVVNVVPTSPELVNNPNSWPKPSQEAFYGLAGKYVEAIEPHTESDPVALLGQFLTMYGNIIGRNAHIQVEATSHYFNLFIVLVGITAKGRKGTSLDQIIRTYLDIDSNWINTQIQSGLSSGEGLIHAVRDPVETKTPIRENKRFTGEYETIISDHGVTDKRLLVVESEFASALRVLKRDGNTLSAIIRTAWDSGDLRSMTKNSPGRASAAHISIIGHITRDELLRYLDSTEYGNGFGNRFLWICVSRSKCLPEGGAIHTVDFSDLNSKLRQAVRFGASAERIFKTDSAKRLWQSVYPELSEGKPGQLGAMTARAEAQVLRLSAIYALLDLSIEVQDVHLKAALALWKYSEDSARFIFGDALGDPIADELLRLLSRKSTGFTKTDIRDHFNKNMPALEIDKALNLLLKLRRIEQVKETTSGRPAERYFISPKTR